MRIGVPTEIKPAEHRVAIAPAGVRELTEGGHEVWVERGAGAGSSLDDADFARAGARIVEGAAAVWRDVDLLLKVKEPVPAEYDFLRPDLTLLTYLHLAASKELTDALVQSGCTAVAYETVRGVDGGLPLLAPMSEIAGRMAAQVGAQLLTAPHGGRGVLMGGISGVTPAQVVVIGAGSSGRQAARIAAGMEADVTVIDLDVDRLRQLDAARRGRVRTLSSNRLTLEEEVAAADLVIGAVLVPGKRAPQVVTEDMVASMRRHAVIVDISIDQGGCVATSHMTTHDEPTFRAHDVIHYAVGNMPGALPRTATYALTNATLPYVERLAGDGVRTALLADAGFGAGVNVTDGVLTEPGVAEAHGLAHTPLGEVWA